MNIILKENFIVDEKDCKSHIKTNFQLKEKCSKVKINFKYSPAIVDQIEDIEKAFLNTDCESLKDSFIKEEGRLKNLITLSLYCDGIFVGCAHRHEIGENIIISPEKSSPGFNPVELKDSRWEVFMSMHGAYCNNIKIELEIEAE